MEETIAQPVVERVVESLKRGTLAHAYLVTGRSGMGHSTAGRWIALRLLCEREHEGCGRCPACRQVLGGSHPDLLWVAAEPGKRQIGIGAVRDEIISHLSRKSYARGIRLVVIEEAHEMTDEAASALLKTLEEPAPDTMILLLTASERKLLPTIRSRSQVLRLSPADRSETAGWLQEEIGVLPERRDLVLELSGGAPEPALEWATPERQELWNWLEEVLHNGIADPVETARECLRRVESAATGAAKQETRDELKEMLSLLVVLVRRRIYGTGRIDGGSAAILDRIVRARGKIDANLNPRFLLIDLFYDLAAAFPG